MSSTTHFLEFFDQFSKRLLKQTGLTMGEYAAAVLSGQDPSRPSDVAKLAKKLLKKRKAGKKLKEKDVDALLQNVVEYMEHQSISGRDRVAFGRNVLTKIVPAITATDLDTLSEMEVAKFTVTDEFRKECMAMIEDSI